MYGWLLTEIGIKPDECDGMSNTFLRSDVKTRAHEKVCVQSF